ncbi:serine/threonine protein kinase [Rivularia sp. UHCC 0363]|uniref:serine/threonine protein kinase n=1 Tax=Rivularia sp. UHCC 0363 TaxID=3110244 RepID=UPI002B20CA53|nr:serine/threonine protein kinase [Rivularia sp. UHCC 0363]MEA5593405.1 serine/threonine protein kinase [Rivularia sp. UHCC 0363]
MCKVIIVGAFIGVLTQQVPEFEILLPLMQLLTKTSQYQIYGITLSSNQPLPILTPASTTTTTDIKVHLTEGNLSNSDKRVHTKGWYQKPKVDGIYYCLSLGGIKEKLDVEIAPDGKQIWINWVNLPIAEVTAMLIGCIIGTALRLQGKICLHSSVIKVDNCAIAIIGAKGAGKSTTAAALAKQGYPILADDIAVLTDCGDSFLVQPGYPRLRLWKSAVNQLYGDEKELSRVFSQTDKHFLELNQDKVSAWGFHNQPLPLAAIYVLGERQQSASAPSIETIIPQMGVMQLITHRYPQSLQLERDMFLRELAILGRLAEIVPMRHLHRGDNLAELGKICDVILEGE